MAESAGSNKATMAESGGSNQEKMTESAGSNKATMAESGGSNQEKMTESAGSNKATMAESGGSNQEKMTESAGSNKATMAESGGSNQEKMTESAGSNKATMAESGGSNQEKMTESDGSNKATMAESGGSNQENMAESGESNQDKMAESGGSNKATMAESSNKATMAKSSGSNQATDPGSSGSNQETATESGGSNQDTFTLKHVKIRNFVNFEGEEELVFEKNGVYFLVGQNSSGKSSVLEAIRRCMSLRYNSSFSKVSNDSEDSIVVCKFKKGKQTIFSFSICKAQSNPTPLEAKPKPQEAEPNLQEATPKHQAAKPKTQVSEPKPKTYICLKGCVLLDEHEQIIQFGMDKVEIGETGELVSQQLSTDTYHAFPKMGTSVDLKEITEWVDLCKNKEGAKDERHGELKSKSGKDMESCCERLLKCYIDNIVFTFPMRSFGPLQWSKSDKIEKKTENYIEASQRAEVIMWYLKRLREKACDGDKGPVTRKEILNEEKYYNFITNNRGGTYYLKEGNKLSTNIQNYEIKVEKEGREISILKQSEGFVEAKLCSILLAVDEFSTILLEDAGIGMHPQMIDRLCTVLSENVKNKVVVISTHNPGFLKPWLIENIFYFNRTANGKFKVATGKSIAIDMDLKSVIPGSILSDQFANFCYAEIIIFVEGPSDHHFIEAMARAMRKQDEDNKVALFSGVQFVSMNTHDKMKPFRRCCKVLNKTYAFVLDGKKREKERIEKWVHEAIKEEEKEKQKSHSMKAKEELDTFFFQWKSIHLEAVFYKVLEELKIVPAKFDSDMKTIVANCFGTKVKFSEAGEQGGERLFSISSIDKSAVPGEKKSFKVFLHGKETFEERARLIEYLLEFYETVDKSVLEQEKMKQQMPLNEGLCELQELRVFLTKLQDNA